MGGVSDRGGGGGGGGSGEDRVGQVKGGWFRWKEGCFYPAIAFSPISTSFGNYILFSLSNCYEDRI